VKATPLEMIEWLVERTIANADNPHQVVPGPEINVSASDGNGFARVHEGVQICGKTSMVPGTDVETECWRHVSENGCHDGACTFHISRPDNRYRFEKRESVVWNVKKPNAPRYKRIDHPDRYDNPPPDLLRTLEHVRAQIKRETAAPPQPGSLGDAVVHRSPGDGGTTYVPRNRPRTGPPPVTDYSRKRKVKLKNGRTELWDYQNASSRDRHVRNELALHLESQGTEYRASGDDFLSRLKKDGTPATIPRSDLDAYRQSRVGVPGKVKRRWIKRPLTEPNIVVPTTAKGDGAKEPASFLRAA
jgi:hypothetical protein